MKKKNNRPQKGISLIEILIILAIIGLLSITIFPPIASQMKKARDAKRKLDLDLIAKNLDQNYDSFGYYPLIISNCNDSNSNIPCDPKTKSNYVYISDGNEKSQWFKLYTNLERLEDQSIEMVGCEYGCGPDCQYNYGISSPNIGLDYCLPIISPTPTIILPTILPTSPTPIPVLYACSPASGPMPEGHCDIYDDPVLSECPKVYPNDPTCASECSIKNNRCKNAKGKSKPN